MSTQPYKTRIRINDSYDSGDRVAIGNEIISLIKSRTNNGFGVSGISDSSGIYPTTSRFPGYSSEYIKSTKFKLAGKTPSNVDLQLTKRMLNGLKLLDHGTGFVEIGYEFGTKNSQKAEGNILGSYGGSANPAKARNFLGITNEELQSILIKYPIITDRRFEALALAGTVALISKEEDNEFFINLDLSDVGE